MGDVVAEAREMLKGAVTFQLMNSEICAAHKTNCQRDVLEKYDAANTEGAPDCELGSEITNLYAQCEDEWKHNPGRKKLQLDVLFLATVALRHHLRRKYQFNKFVLAVVANLCDHCDDGDAHRLNAAVAYFARNATTFNDRLHSAFCVSKLAAACGIRSTFDARTRWAAWVREGLVDGTLKAVDRFPRRHPSALPKAVKDRILDELSRDPCISDKQLLDVLAADLSDCFLPALHKVALKWVTYLKALRNS